MYLPMVHLLKAAINKHCLQKIAVPMCSDFLNRLTVLTNRIQELF